MSPAILTKRLWYELCLVPPSSPVMQKGPAGKRADPRSLHSGPGRLLLPHGGISWGGKGRGEYRTGCEPASGLQSGHGEGTGPASGHTG